MGPELTNPCHVNNEWYGQGNKVIFLKTERTALISKLCHGSLYALGQVTAPL